MKSKYINPYTDFGFKKLFGEEGSKDLLVDFLNELLPAHHQIAKLHFKNSEKLNDTASERKAIFDIYCQTSDGTRFIVEMQKAKVKFFKDRSLFYSTFPIKEQAKKGGWNFNLLPVYFIAILDFCYEEKEEKQKFRRDICLKDQDGDVFYDKLHFKFLQMPLFNKQANELDNHFDKWLYFLKNLENFNEIPKILNEPIFKKGFDIARIARLKPKQFEAYQKSLVEYWEVKNVMETSFEEGKNKGLSEGKIKGKIEGKIEGRIEGKLEGVKKVAKALKEQHISIEIISKTTGLSLTDIQKL